MNPDIAGLPLKRLSAMGWANAEGTNMDIEARDESMKFEVAPESIRVEIESGMPGIRVGTKKEISDWEVRVALREGKCTGETVCSVAMRPKVHTWMFRSLVSFPKVQ